MQTDIFNNELEQINPEQPLAFYRAFGRLTGQLKYLGLVTDSIEKALAQGEEGEWLLKLDLPNIIRGIRQANELVELVDACERAQQAATFKSLLEARS